MSACDLWLLASKGLIDEVALDIAARGLRPVRLTERERQIAALIIRSDYRRLCAEYGLLYDDSTCVDLVYEHVWMVSPPLFPALGRPPRNDAVNLYLALPDGCGARETVRYWTDPGYRVRKQARNRDASRLARSAEAA